MKTKLIVFGLFLMSLTISYGHTPVKIQKTSNPAIFNLTYSGDKKPKVVTVEIRDEEGRVLANRTVQSIKTFSLPLNFDRREFGTYYVTVNAGPESETQKIVYGPQSTITLQREHTEIISYVKKLQTGQLLVSVPKDQTTMARITVFDRNRNILFTTKEKAEQGIAFLINTKNVDGATSIEVTDAAY